MGWPNPFEVIRDEIVLPILEPIFAGFGFEDETVYAWEVICIRMISDEALPINYQLTNNMLNAIRNEENISDAFVTTVMSGAKATILKYVQYGEDHYSLGSPTFTFKTPPVHKDRFETIVAAELVTKGFTLVGDYSTTEVKVPTRYELGLAYLIQHEGYTNHKDVTGTDYIFYEIEVDEGDYKAHLKNYTARDTYTSHYIDLPDYDDSVYQVYYVYSATVDDGSGVEFDYVYTFPFNYTGSTGQYPEMVDSSIGDYDQEDATKILPIAVIRQHSEFPDETITPIWYDTTKELFNKLNMDMDAIIQAISEDEDGNPNPSLAELKDAFMLCGVSLYSESDVGKHYLYFFFKMMYETIAVDSYDLYTSTNIEDVTKHIIRITESTFNVTMFFNYIRRQVIEESIGSINTIARAFDINSPLIKEVGEQTKYYDNSSVTFKRQITSTHCEYITIHGLQFLSKLTHEDDLEYGKVHSMVTAGSEGNGYYLIPLSYVFLDLYPHDAIEQLIYESLHLVYFAVTSVDLEWYETEAFSTFIGSIMTIIAIIALAYGIDAKKGLAVLRELLVQYVLRELAKRLLEEHAITVEQKIVVVAAYVYFAGKGSEWTDFALDAKHLVDAVTRISEMYVFNSGIELEKLEDEYDKDKKETDKIMKELEELWASIYVADTYIDPLMLIKKPILNDELPTEYYARTLCNNTTRISINYIKHYVDTKRDVTLINVQ